MVSNLDVYRKVCRHSPFAVFDSIRPPLVVLIHLIPYMLDTLLVERAGTPCGIKPISNVPGVENYDVTDFVESHTRYADAIPHILQHIRFAEP